MRTNAPGSVAVGVRELKANLSRYLKEARKGKTVVVTDRGTPICHILPATQSTEERARELVRAGLISWNGERFRGPSRRPAVRGRKTVAELLIEDRR